MKKWIWINVVIMLCIFSGCARKVAPIYIKENKYPYERKFYASLDDSFKAVVTVLEKNEWITTKMTTPAAYEGAVEGNEDGKLIFAEKRDKSLGVLAEYHRINIYLRNVANFTLIEIRYASQVGLAVKKIHKFKNDRLIEGLFHDISQILINDHLQNE